jgi:PAS domain S-box-containing protein
MEKLTVLLADGDSTSRRQLEKLLEEKGVIRTITTDSKREALKLYRKEQPDMVFIDIGADDEQWFSWLKNIRKEHEKRKIFLICDAVITNRFPKEICAILTGILQRPISEDPASVLIQESLASIEIQKQLDIKTHKIKQVRNTYAERIETERFVAVRQLVENISSFIGQIANDVEGGVRYFNEIPYFVAIHNRNLKIVMANTAFKKQFGNIIHADSWHIYRGKASQPDHCPVGLTIRTGSVQKMNAEVEYSSGTRIPIIVHTSPIFNNNGEIELILEVSAGVKEVQQLKREVKTTQQRYQQLFDEVPCYIAVLDRKFQITAHNRKFVEDFGNQTGDYFFDILKQRDMPVSYCPIQKSLEDAQPHQSEMVFTTREDKHLRTMMWTSPILTPAKKLTQILVIFVDITNLRQLENNLSSLGLMLSSITHGIKGILTGLDAGLYMIDSGFYKNKAGKIEEGLDVAKLMAERMKKIIHDILYYSKERELRLKKTDAYRFLCDVASLVKAKITSANIEFKQDFDLFNETIFIDEGVLSSALVNLIDNSVEACIEDKSTRRFCITFRSYLENERIVFEIEDNGPGIDKKNLSNIFTIFYSTKGPNGTGLGLYITDRVVRQHKGTIRVDSKPYEKTIFSLTLPISEAVEPVAERSPI